MNNNWLNLPDKNENFEHIPKASITVAEFLYPAITLTKRKRFALFIFTQHLNGF